MHRDFEPYQWILVSGMPSYGFLCIYITALLVEWLRNVFNYRYLVPEGYWTGPRVLLKLCIPWNLCYDNLSPILRLSPQSDISAASQAVQLVLTFTYVTRHPNGCLHRVEVDTVVRLLSLSCYLISLNMKDRIARKTMGSHAWNPLLFPGSAEERRLSWVLPLAQCTSIMQLIRKYLSIGSPRPLVEYVCAHSFHWCCSYPSFI